MIYCEIDLGYTKTCTKVCRSYKNFNLDNFQADFNNIDWHSMYTMIDINDKVKFFNESLIALYEVHAPYKTITISQKSKQQPWFTDNLMLMSKLKRRAWSRYKKTRLPAHKQYFCEIRNYYNSAVKAEKRCFFNSCTLGLGSKDLWKNLRSWNLLPSKSVNTTIPPEYCHPDHINNHFLDVIPDMSADPDYVAQFNNSNSPYDSQFQFQPATLEEVKSLLCKQKFASASADGLSGKMLFLASPLILEPLTHIVNFSFETGLLPTLWKTSIVYPLPKAKEVTGLAELRPICKQPVPLKIAESIMFAQLNQYSIENNIIPMNQSGFRKNHGTSTVLCSVVDDILRAKDVSLVTSLVLLDMTRAFDSLDIKCLLSKLKYYGITGSTISWFESYLCRRHQYVSLLVESGLITSDVREIRSGVPQGSVLAPLLFSVYIADLQAIPTQCTLHMYADDLQLYLSYHPNNLVNSISLLNSDINSIACWAERNCLLMNASKSQYIIFGSPQLLQSIQPHSVYLKASIIERLDKVKNLGVTLDASLRFEEQVSLICQRAFYSLKQLACLREDLDIKTKTILIEALVLSHLNYADTVYGPCLRNDDKFRLQKIQNCCVRFIKNIPFRAHVTPFLRELKMLKLTERRFIHYTGLVLNVLKNKNPKYLHNKITWRSDVHDRDIRRNTMCIPRFHKSLFQSSFTYLAPYICNHLTALIEDVTDVNPRKVKCHLKSSIFLGNSLDQINFNMF